MNTIGCVFRVTVFGESHGPAVGAVVHGCPAGVRISPKAVQADLNRRRPGRIEHGTPRNEPDRIEISGGVRNGKATGKPIRLVIRNRDVDSKPYEALEFVPRPGHADYAAFIKYGKSRDFRGGGIFSGRMTAPLVAAGAIARSLLGPHGMDILAYTCRIAAVEADVPDWSAPLEDTARAIDMALPAGANPKGIARDLLRLLRRFASTNQAACPDENAAAQMKEAVLAARREGDSVGGVVECVISGMPAGLGEPFFDTIEGELSKVIFSIPAVKGIQFGSGFGGASMRGSEHNDQFDTDGRGIWMRTNNSGGILGGISTGMPVFFRVAFKPTPSIAKSQDSVDMRTKKHVRLRLGGRFDTCIVPRAVPVVEACAAIAMADFFLRSHR
jgi:chorismate synthase